MNQHESEFHDLIEQLKDEQSSTPEPNHHFTDQLRGRLLAEYDKNPGWQLGRLTNIASAIAILALAIFGGWFFSQSQQQPTIAGEVIQTTRETETAVNTTPGNVIYTTLQVSKYVDDTYTWQATVEHWQTADSRLNRTIVTDEDGQLDHFSQYDGARLFIGNTLNPIYSPNRRFRSYFVLADDPPDINQAGTPPFYSDLAWNGLADVLVQTEWDCANEACVIERLYQPPLGISPDRHASGEFGWGGSLVSSEEVNGRLIDTLIINYSLQDGVKLPVYRLVKVDHATYRPLAIFDYDGDRLLRSIEVVSQDQIVQPLSLFQIVPESVEQTVLNGYMGIVDFGDIQFTGYGWSVWPSDTPNNLVFDIFWQAKEMPDDELTSFVHILDENGDLIYQHDAVLQWDAPAYTGEEFTAHYTLEERLENGRYQVEVGVYNLATGQRLATSGGETAVIVDNLVIDNLDNQRVDTTENSISFGDNISLFYNHVIQGATREKDEVHILRFLWYARQTPTENLVAFVHLLDEDGQIVQQQDQELDWTAAAGQMVKPDFTEYALQSVAADVPDGRYQVQAGLYEGATGQRVTATQNTIEGETAILIDTITIGDISQPAQNSIWSISLAQAARSSIAENITIEMVIGYDLSAFPDGDYVLKLHYASPDWEQATDGRSPIDGMSDYLPLTEPQGEITIDFSGNPQEMQSITGTANPVPVIILGQFHEMSGGRRFETLTVVTNDEFPILLDSTEATTYRIVE